MRSISETSTPYTVHKYSIFIIIIFRNKVYQKHLTTFLVYSYAGSCLKPGFESVFLCIFTSPCLGEYLSRSKLLVVGKLSANPHWNSVRDKTPNLVYYGKRGLNGTLLSESTNQQVYVNSIGSSLILLTKTMYLHMFGKIKKKNIF